MKTTRFTIAFLLTSLFCQAQITEPEDTFDANAPAFKFETEIINYGKIEKDADGKRAFVFTNIGNRPLIIEKVKGSCGCTVPTWPREPIAAGESSKIKVKYATNRVGAFSKSITLTSNAINAPKKSH